jgi:hypothetical protein
VADESAEAIIEDGVIVIRVPIANLQAVLDGGWGCNVYDKRYKITDADVFASELCRELNREEEDGTTPIHRLFDKSINEALNQGALGIDEHEDQDGEDIDRRINEGLAAAFS